MKKCLLFVLIVLLGLPLAAAAAGISGDCSNCHTMHNSQEGNFMVEAFSDTGELAKSAQLNQNLLRYDCLACHARGGEDNIFPGFGVTQTQIPQVYHTNADDLAGGNFAYISGTKGSGASDRKGHNVRDLFDNGDTNSASATYARPPGFPDYGGHRNNDPFGADFSNFTCAGAAGCHGTRNQVLDNGDKRVGIAAVTGAHHLSTDGLKNPNQMTSGDHNPTALAGGYRFIPGLKGAGNVEDRWQNASASSHNEYFGADVPLDLENVSCQACHVGGNPKTTSSAIQVPNQSMSGFCSTCHGDFHSAGDQGTSGAFLRHPSDFVIPDEREYAAYQDYNITAPVARPDLLTIGDINKVRPGTDMVMCLSCHVAHASDYEGMLRFDYATMTAGSLGPEDDRNGCLACHTNK